MAPRRSRWFSLTATSLAISVLSMVSLGGCGEPDERDAAGGDTYATVIKHFLVEPADPEVRSVVFVVALGAEPLSLEHQVAVIDRLADSYDLRFVDDLDAAIDPDVVGAPPREGGFLLGLGTMSVDAPYTIRVESYTDADTVTAHLLTVVARGDTWLVTGDELVDPEVLGGGE